MRKQIKPNAKLEPIATMEASAKLEASATLEAIATLENVNSELSFLGTYLGDGEFNDENDNGVAHGEKHNSSSHRGRGNVDEANVTNKKPHHHSQNHKVIFNRTDGYAVRSKVNILAKKMHLL
jgi:hypothetical protein